MTSQFAGSINKFLKRKRNHLKENVSTTPDTVRNEETLGLNCVEELLMLLLLIPLLIYLQQMMKLLLVPVLIQLLIKRGPPAITDNFGYPVNDISNRRFNPILCNRLLNNGGKMFRNWLNLYPKTVYTPYPAIIVRG